MRLDNWRANNFDRHAYGKNFEAYRRRCRGTISLSKFQILNPAAPENSYDTGRSCGYQSLLRSARQYMRSRRGVRISLNRQVSHARFAIWQALSLSLRLSIRDYRSARFLVNDSASKTLIGDPLSAEQRNSSRIEIVEGSKGEFAIR